MCVDDLLASHEESKDDELAHVCSDCSSNGQNDEKEIAAVIQWKPTVHLG
jgi:hypothetical protein